MIGCYSFPDKLQDVLQMSLPRIVTTIQQERCSSYFMNEKNEVQGQHFFKVSESANDESVLMNDDSSPVPA